MNRKRFGVLQPILGSSQDPEKISLFIKGLIPFILFLTTYFQVDVTENELQQGALWIGMVVTGGMGLWGIIRKFLPK